MVALCSSVGWGIYAIGLYLTARLGPLWAGLYAGYLLWIEWRVLSRSCRRCHYYGRRCAFGRGRVCGWLLERASDRPFSAEPVSWLHVVPDAMVSLIPLGAGIGLLVHAFSVPVLGLVIALVGLSTAGTGYVRGHLACRYCRQRELGCPAERLFRAQQDG
jgi:hypothetical protein